MSKRSKEKSAKIAKDRESVTCDITRLQLALRARGLGQRRAVYLGYIVAVPLPPSLSHTFTYLHFISITFRNQKRFADVSNVRHTSSEVTVWSKNNNLI